MKEENALKGKHLYIMYFDPIKAGKHHVRFYLERPDAALVRSSMKLSLPIFLGSNSRFVESVGNFPIVYTSQSTYAKRFRDFSNLKTKMTDADPKEASRQYIEKAVVYFSESFRSLMNSNGKLEENLFYYLGFQPQIANVIGHQKLSENQVRLIVEGISIWPERDFPKGKKTNGTWDEIKATIDSDQVKWMEKSLLELNTKWSDELGAYRYLTISRLNGFYDLVKENDEWKINQIEWHEESGSHEYIILHETGGIADSAVLNQPGAHSSVS
jgi:hypothetical protein